tara:strand:- start:270 stop:758 length:489 start_codon:yes stop_codon:yes gene_type:complete
MSVVERITKASQHIYNSIEYSPNEHYYQAHLNLEIQDMGYVAQNEVTVSLHHITINGNKFPLPDGLNGRIDILLETEKLIIETKSIKKCCGISEYTQLRKYMKEYHSKWGNLTKGMLINFGDNELEVFYMYYNDLNQIICERLVKENKSININVIDKTNIIG